MLLSLFHKLKNWTIQEITEFLPWSFISYIIGIMLTCCFHLSLAWIYGLLGTAFLWFWNRKRIFSFGLMILFFILLGISNTSWHFQKSRHPILILPLYHTRIEATVLQNQILTDKQILTLNEIHWVNPDLKMPQKIRVHFRKTDPTLNTGDKINALVSVYPPNGINAENLWFDKIGATGIAEELNIIHKTQVPESFFSEVRIFINQHLFQILPAHQAEIAAPLITGEQKLVSRTTYQIYRQAGIAHVLSVSGFHMALLAGFLFFLIRGICALLPRLTLTFDSKKIAALISIIGTFLYLGLSGYQIPAVRAFLMIAFVFLGILINRRVFSMRSLILAGFLMLLLHPQMLLSISFQLSFTAVAVLINICNFIQEKGWSKFTKTTVGFFALNIGVTLALTPFIAYHFHQLTPYSILGNMLLSGTFSFFIMPLLFIGCILIFAGWDIPFFSLAGKGLDLVYWGAEKIAQLSYSEIAIQNFSTIAFISFCFGIILLTFLKTPLKWIGSLGIIFALITFLISS